MFFQQHECIYIYVCAVVTVGKCTRMYGSFSSSRRRSIVTNAVHLGHYVTIRTVVTKVGAFRLVYAIWRWRGVFERDQPDNTRVPYSSYALRRTDDPAGRLGTCRRISLLNWSSEADRPPINSRGFRVWTFVTRRRIGNVFVRRVRHRSAWIVWA